MAVDFDDDSDTCSLLVPVNVINTAGVIKSITSGGVQLAEDTNNPWDSTRTYPADEFTYVDGMVYVSTAKTGNLNKRPTMAVNRFNADGSPNYWVEVGPTNRRAMFDGKVSTQTVAASPLVITLAPGAFNTFAIFGADADTYSVSVRDATGGNIIYSEDTTQLEGSMPGDYYEYFFDRFKPLTQFIRSGIEPYNSSEITITFSKATGPVRLGMYAIGDKKPMGIPQRDAVVNPGGFTVVKQNAYGDSSIQPRPNATGMTIPCVTDIENANIVKADIDAVSGTPCVVIGSESPMYEWMTTFGVVRAQMAPIPYPYATITLTVTGFI